MKKIAFRAWLPLLLIVALLCSSCGLLVKTPDQTTASVETKEPIALSEIPNYRGEAYVEVNGNVPFFTDAEKASATASFETYSDLDALNRCGVAVASVGKDLMPTEERGSIGSVKPSGWQTVKYDIVDGQYLYNRCHLIGYQLTAENANKKNLITGTRYLNVIGMLPFENMTADYVKETENHVLYRVTPIFNGTDLVALGVLMEGWSVEDNGEGVLFCVFCYNVQPGIVIDYATGESRLAEDGEELMTMGSGTTATPAETQSAPTTEGNAQPTESTLALTSVTSPIARGSSARLEVTGKPNIEYRATVHYASTEKELDPVTSNENGTAVFEWTIVGSTKTGDYTITVSGGNETLEVPFTIISKTDS